MHVVWRVAKTLLMAFRMTSQFGSVIWSFLLILMFAAGACRGQTKEDPPVEHSAGPNVDEAPGLRGGTNEFGIWTGYSPSSFVLKGTSTDRQLFLLNVQYARTLVATRPVTLKYTADAVPIALEFQPAQRYLVAGRPLN